MTNSEQVHNSVAEWMGFSGKRYDHQVVEEEVDLLLKCIKEGLQKGYKIGLVDTGMFEKGEPQEEKFYDVQRLSGSELLSPAEYEEASGVLLEELSELLRLNASLDLAWITSFEGGQASFLFPLDELE